MVRLSYLDKAAGRTGERRKRHRNRNDEFRFFSLVAVSTVSFFGILVVFTSLNAGKLELIAKIHEENLSVRNGIRNTAQALSNFSPDPVSDAIEDGQASILDEGVDENTPDDFDDAPDDALRTFRLEDVDDKKADNLDTFLETRKTTNPKEVQPNNADSFRSKDKVKAEGIVEHQRCTYHGECPVLTSCVASGHHVDGSGSCLPYKVSPNDIKEQLSSNSDLMKCTEACMDELFWDEYYFQNSHPANVQSSPAANGNGCVLTYDRVRGRSPDHASQKPRSVDEWMSSRFHRLVRVDPVVESADQVFRHTGPVQWQALCGTPCDDDSDCAAESGMVCTNKREHERPIAEHPSHPERTVTWLKMKPDRKTCRHKTRVELAEHGSENLGVTEKPMIIVTAANTYYFRGLANLIASVKFWEPNRKVVVYNLGMEQDQLEDARSWSNVEELRWADGIPPSYPSHVRAQLKNYAWKPPIINETVHEFRSVLWLDAGSVLTGPIGPVEELVRQTGMFLVHGQDENMYPMAHSKTYAWHGFNKDTFVGGPHCGGNTQAYGYPSRYIDTIVVPNAKCALNSTCIAPVGSSLNNHRFDQTSLSILAYSPGVRAPHFTEFLAGSRGQLPKNLRWASRFVTWTSRQSSSTFSSSSFIRSTQLNATGQLPMKR